MKEWIEQFHKKKNFIHSTKAIGLLRQYSNSKDKKARALIPVLLMNRYLQAQNSEQSRIVQLLEEAGRKGYSFLGMTNRKRPVFTYIIQFRLRSLYPYLDCPPEFKTPFSFNITGYLGRLIKLGVRISERGEELEAVQKEVGLYQNAGETLERFAKEPKHPSGLEFKKLIDAINQDTVPELSKDVINRGYQVQSDPRVPKVGKFALHDATMYYNDRQVKHLLELGANPLAEDFWGRNFLHIAEIVESDEIRAIAKDLGPDLWSKLSEQKDGLGRRPTDCRAWKSKINFTSSKNVPSDNGGWNPQVLEKYEKDCQQIDVVPYREMTFMKFSADYMSCLKPVLIRGGSAQMKQLQTLWRKESFVSRFKELPISIGDIPYAGTFGRAARRLKFGEYKPSLKEYAFTGVRPSEYPKLFEDFKYLGVVNKLANRQVQFYQGIAGTGAPVHSHIDSWNTLVHGRKRWFVFPPLKGYYSTKPILEWMEDGYNHVEPIEFIQEAGDIAYIPRHWGHAVLNLQESVGVAVEFSNPYAV